MDLRTACATFDRPGPSESWPRMLLARDDDDVVLAVGAHARTVLADDATPAHVLDEAGALADRHGFVVGGVRFDGARTPLTSAWAPFGPGFFFAPRALARRAAGVDLDDGEDVIALVDGASREAGRAARASRPRELVSNDVEQRRFAEVGERALEALAHGALTKIVLARRVVVDASFGAGAIASLLDTRDVGLTYAFSPSPGIAFVGRTPETLLAGRDGNYRTEALAGTRPRAKSPADDAALVAALEASPKDAREHALVAEHIDSILRQFSDSVVVLPRRVRSLARLHHLETPFLLSIDDARARALALELHPTPALAGAPVELARHFLAAHEGFDRGLYGGLVGTLEPHALDLRVAIRGGLVIDGSIQITVGAGLVLGSNIDDELAETAHKAAALVATASQGGALHA